MQLYQLLRVRKFLEYNADEYSEWLLKREKLILNYKKRAMIKNLKEAREKAALKRQNKMCLECKFSNFSDNGILCKIHSEGLPEDIPMRRYCPDYEKVLSST